MRSDRGPPNLPALLVVLAVVVQPLLGAHLEVFATVNADGSAPPLRLLSTISVSGAPNQLGVDPQSGNLFVPIVTGGLPDSNLLVLSAADNNVLTTIPMQNYPQVPVLDPAGGSFYLPNGPSTISVVSTATASVVATIGGLGGGTPTYDPAGNAMIVPNYEGTNATMINATTNVKMGSIGVGSFQPLAMTYDPFDRDLYAIGGGWARQVNLSVNSGSTGALLAKYPIWNYTQGTGFLSEMTAPKVLEYDPVNHDLYFSNLANNTVTVISSTLNRSISVIGVGRAPGVPTCDPQTGDVYVPNQLSDNVSVISGSTNSVVATIPGIPSPWEIAFDPASGDLLVPSSNETIDPYSGHQVAVVSGTDYGVLGTVQVGTGPQTPMYDPANGDVYVANFWSNNISVLGVPQPPVTIFGLPPWEFYSLVSGAGAVVLAAAVVVLVCRRRKREDAPELLGP